MKKVATVLAVATVTMAATMDNLGDDNFMANPFAHKQMQGEMWVAGLKEGGHRPNVAAKGPPGKDFSPLIRPNKLPIKPTKKPILDKAIAADELGDDNFAVDDFGDDNFALDDFADENFAVDDFGDENLAVEFVDEELWSRTDLPMHPVNREKYRWMHENRVVAAEDFDDNNFAVDDFADENFAVDEFGDENFAVEFGDDELMAHGGTQHGGSLKKDKKDKKDKQEKPRKQPKQPKQPKEPELAVLPANELFADFGDDHFAVDDFADENFAVDDFGDDNYAVDDFADENFAVEFADEELMVRRPVNPHFDLLKDVKKPADKAIAADEFADENFADFGDDNFAVDDFGDDNFAVDDFGDENFARIIAHDKVYDYHPRVVAADEFDDNNFAVDDFGDDNFAVDDFGDDNFAVDDFGDDNYAVDDFADENFAVEFGDDEFRSVVPQVERPLPLRDSHTPSLRGGHSLHQLGHLLREAH